MNQGTPLASDDPDTEPSKAPKPPKPPKSPRRHALIATGSMLATGVVLATAYFPFLFDQWLPRDDEGVFVFALREFLNGKGHLYSTVWSDLYGPFYYLVMSTVFRVIHQQPSLENGRWIVLVLTTLSAILFGASVWRVTKSLPFTLVCETGAFLILIQVAGNEPMHPGSLGVFLISLVAFEVSSYAVTRRTAHLVAIGAAIGALMMTKVNAGGLVAAAVVFGLVVGSEKVPRWIQIVVAALTALLPLALVSQHLSLTWVATFAVLVSVSIVGMYVLMSNDQLPLPTWPLVPVVSGAAVAALCSLAFPVITGTPITSEIRGAFIRPLSLPNALLGPASVRIEWFTVVLTMAGIGAAIVFRSLPKEKVAALSGWTNAALAAVALWLLGIGVTVFAGSAWVTAQWLPALLLLPALAYCSNSPEPIRFALRSMVLLATLQILVAYPVAGSQVGWGTVAMVVPCAIALAAGAERSRVWRESSVWMRGGAAAVLCLALVIATNQWPFAVWKGYRGAEKLGLPGTGLMRIDPTVAATLQQATADLRAQCDTFYGVPNLNSFYIFTGLPAVTAQLANGGPTGLTDSQQGQVVAELQAARDANKRVCILRDTSQAVILPPSALTEALSQYSSVVATAGSYTISRHS